MYKKIYYYSWFRCYFIVAITMIMALALIILFLYDPSLWWLVTFPFALLILSMGWLIKNNFLKPIFVYEDKIQYKGKEYPWNMLRITVKTVGKRSFHYAYVLYFENEKNKVCEVYLNEGNLDTILNFYPYAIDTFHSHGLEQIAGLKTTKKIKKKIEMHNRKVMKHF